MSGPGRRGKRFPSRRNDSQDIMDRDPTRRKVSLLTTPDSFSALQVVHHRIRSGHPEQDI
jgi:hypothetical protein